MNKYLIKEVKEFCTYSTIELDKILGEISKHLKNDSIERINAMKLNDTIYDIYEEGMQLVKQICIFYQDKWKN